MSVCAILCACEPVSKWVGRCLGGWVDERDTDRLRQRERERETDGGEREREADGR